MNTLIKTLLSRICVVALTATPIMLATACGQKKVTEEKKIQKLAMVVPYSSDSAYRFIEEQVAFGPRVAGSEENRKCAEYIADKLKKFGADSIIIQDFRSQVHTGDDLRMRNIMGRFKGSSPEADSKPPVLLLAHYDTRPWADRDSKVENQTKPILGANDGASGVATLLAIAHQFSQQRPQVNVDLLFVDGEDYGRASDWENCDSTWCLGAQYWTANMPADYQSNRPRFGILVDMVGARNARFPREFISDRFAEQVVDKVWSMAAHTGHSRFFINEKGGSIIDDHYFINLNTGIPTIDIIDIANAETGSFPPTWHTVNDNISQISRATLRYVGQTVSNVIYYEKP